MFSLDQVKSYRAATYRLQQPLTSKEQAIDYVNQRGFIFFWPINGITLPSLWAATAGDRPVADAHDDPGHVTWGWKDSVLGTHVWYYAKVLRKKATIISLELAPFFYALTENYGSPEEDYLTLYEQGRLTQEARSVYKALLDQGPLDTVALRKAARLTSPALILYRPVRLTPAPGTMHSSTISSPAPILTCWKNHALSVSSMPAKNWLKLICARWVLRRCVI